MRDLAGRVAVVTGGASGIGFGMARAFLGADMKVVLADVRASALEEAAQELGAYGEVRGFRTDVTKPEDLDALAEFAWSEFGAVHVLCNNAGVGLLRTIEETSLEDWSWVLGVNLSGVFHGIHSFLPRMIRQPEGHVVNTASMAGLLSFPNIAAYSASKQAVVALSETLAQELRTSGAALEVSVLCPGYVRTNIMRAESSRSGGGEGDVKDAEDPAAQIQSGMEPLEVGQLVVEAIRESRFYVFTHPDWKPLLRERFEAILADRCPAAPQPPVV